MINKRGDIPVTILVLGVFLICTVAFASFIYADSKFKGGFYGLNLQEKINSDVEQIYTYVNLGYSLEDAVNFVGKGSKGECEDNIDVENQQVIVTKNLCLSSIGKGNKKLISISRRLTFKL
ncbi:MAG: hypothetical protein AABY22_30730 [Nanoarchaeota archaeon]